MPACSMRWPRCWRPISRCARSTCRATADAMTLADNTLQGWADDLAQQLPDNATLLGWSLGGQVAMRAALDHPHKIARLVLLASTPKFVATEDWEHGMAPADLQDFGAALLADPQATLLRFLSLQTRGMNGQKTLLQQLRQSLLAASARKPRGAGGRTGDPARHRSARGTAAIDAADPGAARRARHADPAGSRRLAGRDLARRAAHRVCPRRACAALVARRSGGGCDRTLCPWLNPNSISPKCGAPSTTPLPATTRTRCCSARCATACSNGSIT